ncbi:MAG: glycosyltransferase family 39 protein [Dehalococcoidia bacterium]
MSSAPTITGARPASVEIARSAPVGLGRVLAIGLIVEAALLFGLTWPLRIWQSPDAITESEPLSAMLGQTTAGFARFVATLVIWGAGYALICHISRRPFTDGARRALFLFPIVFALTLVPTWAAASKDVYHYVLEGRTLVVYGESPLTTPPAAFPDDPLRWIVSSWEWEPSRYGPLWAQIAAVPVWVAGDHLRAAVLGFKVIGVVSFLAIVALVYATARRVRPDLAIPAFVFVAWNPLLLFESAANAHNDIVMVAFTALALYCAARRNWTLAFPALAAAVLVKFTTGLLGPLLLIWAWQTTRGRPVERRQIIVGLGLAVCLTVVCYALFWTGADTFRALTGAAGDALNSPGWLLREVLERLGVSERAAGIVVTLPLALLFAAAYIVLLRGTKSGDRLPSGSAGILPASMSSDRTFPSFVWCGVAALTAYLWLASWWFWPWYVTWVLPLAALLAGQPIARFTLLWSLGAMAAYIPITFRPFFWGEPPDDRMPLAVTVTVFGPAALYALLALRRRLRQRARSNSPAEPASPHT